MRTTINLSDDIYLTARLLAEAKQVALGQVVSELARLGLKSKEKALDEQGLPVFAVAENAPPFGGDDVARAEAEE